MWLPFHLRSPALDATSGGDPFFASVVLLCVNDNKGNATTSFVDQSSAPHTLTANGNAAYSTAQAPTGMTSSMALDGSRDFLSTPDSTDWTLGSGDFTLEAYVRLNAAPAANVAIFHQLISTGGVNRSWLFGFGNVGNTTGQGLELLYSTTGANIVFVARDTTFSTGVWYHVAACRSGNNLLFFKDGSQLGTAIDVTGVTISDSSKPFGIGGSPETGGFDTNGWIACARITKGVARYTANFTPPTLPLPNS